MIAGLLGVHNCCAPTLSSLTTNFGLQPLVGKQLATVSDARLGTRTDNLVAVERLLSISGEDYITVDRKYQEPWTGKLLDAARRDPGLDLRAKRLEGRTCHASDPRQSEDAPGVVAGCGLDGEVVAKLS